MDMVTRRRCRTISTARSVLAAAPAGKHVICEKPLCPTLEEADEMIAAGRDAGVMLMYAEELCFAPKYVRAKELVDEGALGESTWSSRARSIPARTRTGSGTASAPAAAS